MKQAPQRLHRQLTGALTGLTSAARRGLIRQTEDYPNFYYRYSHDIAHVFGLRIFGIYATNGQVKARPWLLAVNVGLIFAPVPIGALVALSEGASTQQLVSSVSWIFYFSMLAVVVQVFSLGGVHVFHRLTTRLELMLTARGMRRYEGWASVSTALIPQMAWAVFCTALGCTALWILSLEPTIRSSLYITWASYLSVGITVVYLSGGIWWIFAGAILAWRISDFGCLRLFPYAPAMTPGIEMLVRCYRISFVGGCIGVILCLTPILTWTRVLPRTPFTIATAVVLVGLSFLALLAIAGVPDWRLSRTVMMERHRVMDLLDRELPRGPGSTMRATPADHYRLTWFQTLASSPKGTINESVVVTLIAALFSAAVPVVLSMFLTPS